MVESTGTHSAVSAVHENLYQFQWGVELHPDTNTDTRTTIATIGPRK